MQKTYRLPMHIYKRAWHLALLEKLLSYPDQNASVTINYIK